MIGDRPLLPEFGSPPVVEVALTIFFEPLTQLRASHIGLLWQNYRDRFPTTEDQPALPSIIESFGTPGSFNVGLQLSLSQVPSLPRSLFVNEPGTEVIQFQSDRFTFNWRKNVSGGEPATNSSAYPRYYQVRERLARELDVLSVFLSRENLGELKPVQCEITYVNEIVADSEDASDILSICSTENVDRLLGHPDQLNIGLAYVIHDAAGVPVGRLHIQSQKVIRRSDRKGVFLLSITSRGRPDGPGQDGAFKFLDRGHELAVQSFAAITTSRMHSRWGEK